MLLLLVKAGRWCSSIAWPWVRKNWKWLIFFPVVLVVWLLGKRSGRVTVVTDDSESDAAQVFREDAEADTAARVARLDEERREAVEEAVEGHKTAVTRQSQNQQDGAEELLGEPERLNSFLHDVGRNQRK